MPKVRHISVIGIATTCSALFLLLVIFLIGTLTLFSRKPADFLPAENTIAVFHNIDQELVQQYIPWFPVLNELQEEDYSGTLAILAPESGSASLVRFTKEDLTSTPKEYWPYTVHVSHKKAGTLLQKRLQSLTKQSGYRDFARTKNPNEQWVYTNTSHIPKASSISTALVQQILLQDAEYASFSYGRIELYGQQQQNGEAALPVAPGEDTLLTLSAWNARQLVQGVVRHPVLYAVLQQHILSFFGPSVSLEYDILPLLEQNIALHIRQNSSGSLVMQISGSNQNIAAVGQILTHMYEGRKEHLPKIELLEMQLDTQFRMRTLRSRPQNAQNIGLYARHTGNEFVLSNDESFLDEEPVTMVLPTNIMLLSSNRRTAGWVQNQRFSEWIDKNLIQTENPMTLPFLPSDMQSTLWLWEERGPLTVISFLFEENEESVDSDL